MEICTVGSVRGESTGKHAGAFSYSERKTRQPRKTPPKPRLRRERPHFVATETVAVAPAHSSLRCTPRGEGG
jgi:hypothetical protein